MDHGQRTKKSGNAPNLQKLTQRGFVKFLVAPPGAPLAGLLLQKEPAAEADWAKELAEVEAKVVNAKSKMDPYGGDTDLASVLRAVDLYAALRSKIRRNDNGQVVTNAWLKMYEMATQLDLVGTAARGEGGKVLRTFCNAELPGAFICAINHFMCTEMPGARFDWVASSLHPAGKDEILGDTYGLLSCNPDRWLMDAEMPGDVTSVEQIATLASRAKERLKGEVDLYTSDAGIDVSPDYNRQEELTARINLGQIVTGLLSLRAGGNLVTKTYTFTHPFSVSVIAVCAALFDACYVTKPQTSRPANSEVYLVGIGFRGVAPEVVTALLAAVEEFDFARPLIPLDVPALAETVKSLTRAARQIHLRQQVEFLEEAVLFFERFQGRVPDLRKGLTRTAGQVQAEWLKANPVEPIPTACHVPAYDPADGNVCQPPKEE